MENNILKPLHMNNSSFVFNKEILANLSQAYDYKNGVYKKVPVYGNTFLPAGGLKTTANDMTKFMIAHLNNGTYNNTNILNKDTIEDMHKKHFPLDKNIPGICYGFLENYINGVRVLGQGGDDYGFHSILYLIPDSNLGFFISTNGENRAKICGSIAQQFMNRYYPQSKLQTNMNNSVNFSKSNLKNLDGVYVSSRYPRGEIGKLVMLMSQPINVKSTKNALLIRYPNGQQDTFKEIAPLLFKDVKGNDITFIANKQGKISYMFNAGSTVALEKIQCPYCVNILMNNSHLSRQSTNYVKDEDRKITDFISTLEERGFIVQEGKLKYIDILKLVSKGIIDTAFANNAGAPYASYLLPPSPNQDPSLAQKPPKGYNPKNPNNYPANIEYAASGLDYKLRADEAIVLIGKTPPPAYNFSYRSYLGFVENERSKDYSNTITAGNKSTGFYHNIGASMGDQINNHNIWTDNTPYGAPGNPFNSSTIIITTADRSINKQMRNALVKSGFNAGIMNDDNIPKGLTNIGLEKGKDTFSFIMRAAIWLDYDAGWNYINNLENYVKVLRITPKTTYPHINPWPIPNLKMHETGTTEFQVVPYARNEVNYLRNEIIKKYQNEGYEPVDLDSKLWILDGYEGILQDVPVYYDNRDGLYIRTDKFKLETDEDFVILYGVDHTQTEFATFFNISFYGEEYWNGVVGANITDELKYPAAKYFPEGYKNSKYYYAVKMARKSKEGNEVIIPYSTGNPKGSAYGVDNNKYAYVGFRIYANPQTNVAPAIFDTIWSRAILFKKRIR